MSFDFLIKQREQRLGGILRVSPCENITPHDANTCTACCAVAAERFLVSAVEADFQRQVSTGLKESSPRYHCSRYTNAGANYVTARN